MKTDNIAFLVLSCDKYADLWEPFARLFERHWADCPFDKYFASNKIPFDGYGFQPILTGEDETWSKGLFEVLLQLANRYEYVLITLEDLFILQPVDTEYLMCAIDKFILLKGNYLRLFVKFIKPHVQFNSYFGCLKKNTPYRQNCVYSLWNIETLKKIIDINENAWDFEKKAVQRGYDYDGFYSVYTTHFVVANMVIKGKLVKNNFKKVKQILPDIQSHRNFLSFKTYLFFKLNSIFFFCFFKFVPYAFQNGILKIAGKRQKRIHSVLKREK